MRIILGNEIAKALGLTPDYIRIEFATMVPGLAARRWDMINTGIYWTEPRSKAMYMVPYERAAISFLVKKGNPLGIEKWEDLAGRAVGVELGGIEETRTREVDTMLKQAGLKGIEVRTFNNFAEAFQSLRAGQVEAATSMVAIRFNADMTAKYQALIAAGKPPKVAIVAVMRKLAILANALLREQRNWTPKAA